MGVNELGVPGFREIAEKLRRSTVLIRAGSRGCGSGVIWSSSGTIVTNSHVARGIQTTIELWDGREFRATTSSRDPRRDLAALRIDAANLPSAIPPDASRSPPGELAIAIDKPLGFVGPPTTGFIHAGCPIRTLLRPFVSQDAVGPAT